MGKLGQDSILRETGRQEQTDQVSLREPQKELSSLSLSPCSYCKGSVVLQAALPCTRLWSICTSVSIVLSRRPLQAHEVMVTLNALSACAAVTQWLLFPTQSHHSCLKCKALQKSCKSRMPALHRVAQRICHLAGFQVEELSSAASANSFQPFASTAQYSTAETKEGKNKE